MQVANDVVKPKNTGTKQVFKNPILEKLTRTHIAAPISMFFILSAGMIYWGLTKYHLPVWQLPVLFFGGWLLLSLIEYSAHRWVFHMHTDTDLRRNIQYKLHGVHHEYPKDKDRLAMPIPMSLLLATIFFGIFYPILGQKTFFWLPGMMTGYATYLFVHYIVHAWAPPQNMFKELWINHSIHHYRNEAVFGVSSPIWDYVFGTMPSKKK